MKNQLQDEIIKNILREGQQKMPENDFNARVLDQVFAEQKAPVLKPIYNYSLLLALVAIGLLFLGTLVFFGNLPLDLIKVNMNFENISGNLFLLFLLVCGFSVFTFFSDIIEEKVMKRI